MDLKFNHIGIPVEGSFDGEIDLAHLKITVSDHANNPFGIQWQRSWEGAPYPELVKTAPRWSFYRSIGKYGMTSDRLRWKSDD